MKYYVKKKTLFINDELKYQQIIHMLKNFDDYGNIIYNILQ